MKRILAAGLVVLLAIGPSLAWGAGTVTVSEEVLGHVKKITWTWTATAGGAADLITVGVYTGEIVALVTDPGAGPPTDLWDLTVTDGDSVDVLNALGANRSTTVTQQVVTGMGYVAGDKLTMNVTNAGNATSGIVILYIR